MANGYLGKISAVVAANTGDYVRKLNDSASTTKAFAKTISSDLSRASRDATKSIESILTPIQRVERALQNAASQKLAFRGFDGAIQTVEQLRKVIEKIADRPVELQFLLKQSGLKTLEQIRQTIGSISEKNLQLALSVGGVEGLRRLREDVREINGKLVNVKVQTDAAELDRLIEVFSQIAPETIRKLKVDVETRQIEQAVLLNKQLVSVATEITGAYGRAKQQFSSFGLDVQAALGPALRSADSGILKVLDDIERQVPITEARFQSLAAEAKKAIATIGTFSEAQQRLGGLATGNELAFQFPRLNANLARARSVGQQALELPAASVAANPEIEGLTRQINRVSELAVAAAARMRSAMNGREAAAAAAEYSRLNGVLEGLVARLDSVALGEQKAAAAAKQAAAEAAAALTARARAEQEYYALSQRLQQQAAADTTAPLIARARAEQEYYALSQRLQQQAAADAAAPLIARARAEQEYYALSQRLQQQAAADAAAPLIARARAEQDYYETSRRLEQQRAADIAASDGAQRARVASGFLNVLQQESDNISNVGLATQLTGNRNPRTQFLDNLGGQIQVLRRQIGELDEPLRTQLGPEIDRITIQFQNMARAGIRISADEARRLSREVAAINASMANRRDIGQRFSERFGGAGPAGLNLGVDQRSLQAIGSQIEFVQERLSRLGAEARGPTLQALERFRETARRLFDAGTIDTESGRAELAALRNELVQTLSAAGGGSRRRLATEIRRAGDVGRGGFDRFGLAIQQAAFAVEDFFSVTGGLDQRIRAAGNNISQLGFVLGSTEGLIIGVAAAIGGQLVAALIKWADAGRSAEDRTKAITDSLSRQKSLVEELASAFNSLGDSIAEKAFSGPSGEAAKFAQQLDDIAKKQAELRRERVVSLDENVVSARASVNVAERNLARQTTAGGAAVAQRALADAQRRLREAEAAAALREAPTSAEVNEAVVRAIRSDAQLRARAAASAASQGGAAAAQAASQAQIDLGERRVQQFLANPVEGSTRELIAALDRQIEALRARGGPAQEVARLQSLIERLRASDSPETAILDAANRAGSAIESAYVEVAQAIQAGIPSARLFERQLSVLSNELRAALNALDAALRLPGSSEADIAARDAAVSAAQGRVEDVRGRVDRATAQADSLRRERTLFPEQQIDAVVERSQRQIDSIGAAANFQQQQLRELLFQRDTVRLQLEAAPADPILIRAEQELNESIRALASEINALDETINSFEQREARRLLGDPERGRQLSMTQQERVNEQLIQGLNDIAARFGEVAAETTGLVDFEGQRAAQNRFVLDQARQVAPLIFGFQDERLNAALQGPSRAALNVADANTVEGARELNRLLRGDDPSKDVNLVELQRQTTLLEGLLRAAEARGLDPVVEIRG